MMKRTVAVAAITVFLQMVGGVARGGDAPPAPAPADAAYRIEMTNALPGPCTLTIYAVYEGGVGKRAFGRGYNAVSHKVDLAGLKLDGQRLKGDLKVVLMPDHWIPADHKPVTATYSVDVTVKAGKLEGSFKGRFGDLAVEGAVGGITAADTQPVPAKARFDFFYPFDARARGGRPTVVLLSKDGINWQSALVDRPSSPTHGGCYGNMGKSDVRIERGVLRGRFSGTNGDDTYECEVKGAAILGNVGGFLTGKVDGKDIGEWPFWGECRPFKISSPDNAVYRIMLHRATPGGQMFDLALDARDGRFTSGVGVTTRNRSSCDVVANDLKVEGNRAMGRIRLTANADDWIPGVAIEYGLEWTIDGLLVRGSFTGRVDGVEVSGPVTGFLEPLEDIRPPWRATVKIARGVKGLTAYTWFNAESDKNGVVRISNFPKAAAVDRSEFRVEGSRLTGVVEGTLKQGVYQGKKLVVKVDGKGLNGLGSCSMEVFVDGESVDKLMCFMSLGSQ